MAYTINWLTKIVRINRADMIVVSTNPEIYRLDLLQFWATIHDIQDDMGITYDPIMRSNAPVTLSGLTYARSIEIINGYRIEFEDGPYQVNLTGANNNLLEARVQNQVSINANNSAGAIVVSSGAGGGGDPQTIAEAVRIILNSDLSIIKDHARAANLQTQDR